MNGKAFARARARACATVDTGTPGHTMRTLCTKRVKYMQIGIKKPSFTIQ